MTFFDRTVEMEAYLWIQGLTIGMTDRRGKLNSYLDSTRITKNLDGRLKDLFCKSEIKGVIKKP